MERHLASCAACRHTADEYAELASLLPAALEVVPPPARLRRNLMAQVYAEAIRSHRPSPGGDACRTRSRQPDVHGRRGGR